MAATIKEIAKSVGVSITSVSLYLNNKETTRVSPATKKRIDAAAEALNYRKNMFASSLSRHESNITGVIIPTSLPLFVNEFTNAILAGIQQVLSAKGYSMLFLPVNGTSSEEIVSDQLQNSAGCDGYFLFSTGFCSTEQVHRNIESLQKSGKPFVTINVPELNLPIHQVILHDLDTALGVSFLLDQGHRDILLVLGREHDVNVDKGVASYEALYEKWGMTASADNILYGNYLAETAYLAVKERLGSGLPPTAICCMSDEMAFGAYAAVRELGLRIPDDISIVGRNNMPGSAFMQPPLTTVDLHMADAGKSAAELLLNVVKGEVASECHKLVIRSTLEFRGSVQSL